jgi:hypothetical protein
VVFSHTYKWYMYNHIVIWMDWMQYLVFLGGWVGAKSLKFAMKTWLFHRACRTEWYRPWIKTYMCNMGIIALSLFQVRIILGNPEHYWSWKLLKTTMWQNSNVLNSNKTEKDNEKKKKEIKEIFMVLGLLILQYLSINAHVLFSFLFPTESVFRFAMLRIEYRYFLPFFKWELFRYFGTCVCVVITVNPVMTCMVAAMLFTLVLTTDM